MFKNTLGLPDPLHDYILANSLKEVAILAELRQETQLHKQARMQISPDQGQLISLLIRLMSARRVLEIGVFTGYSSLTIALALPTDGVLVACDISEEYTAIAKRYWRQAGVQDKIELRIAPALETLDALLESGQAETFDFAFVDADKANYSNYYDRTLKLLRPGGLMAIDNVLWSGRVADPQSTDKIVQTMRVFNQKVAQDDRVQVSLLPLGDGITLALKKI
ncbi:MAG: class I SAM-dependent methyltransferase [Alkalinema sp. CAN_BIN05]|nr:class I SAM-dependent methyltransferase [Alkalinema sp. CAN_BIN05]